MTSFKQHWDLFAAIAVLCIGAVLVSLGHAEGRDLLTLGSGIVTGCVLGRRRNGVGASIPPAASVLAFAGLAAAVVSGCGGSQPSGSTCRAVQAATVAACSTVEAAERLVCEAPPADAGVP